MQLHANGVRFRINTHGDGERVALLLHGFPDDAGSMYPLMDRLAERGFTCYAPFMRGYGESQTGETADFYVADLAEDVVDICEQLDLNDVLLIGHDWGAIAAYAACNLAPEFFSGAVAMSVPPAKTLLRNTITHPEQLRRSWYIFFFQLPVLPEIGMEAENMRLIEDLWRAWSPSWDVPIGRLAEVKLTFRMGRTIQHALAYYRGLLRGALSNPARFRESWQLVSEPIRVPTQMMVGADDGCIAPAMFDAPGHAFSSDWTLEIVEDAGHFLPLEAPDRVAELIFDWVGE